MLAATLNRRFFTPEAKASGYISKKSLLMLFQN
jgi:hypothetical protein